MDVIVAGLRLDYFPQMSLRPTLPLITSVMLQWMTALQVSDPTLHLDINRFFPPPNNRNPSLDTYCCIVECNDISFKKQKRLYKLAYNFTESQLAELVLFQKDQSIVVYSADKG